MKTFDYSLVKDPQYFKDGRMDAHSDHTYYRDGEEAKEKETSFRYDLNGIWKFHYARNYGSEIPGSQHCPAGLLHFFGAAQNVLRGVLTIVVGGDDPAAFRHVLQDIRESGL